MVVSPDARRKSAAVEKVGQFCSEQCNCKGCINCVTDVTESDDEAEEENLEEPDSDVDSVSSD